MRERMTELHELRGIIRFGVEHRHRVRRPHSAQQAANS